MTVAARVGSATFPRGGGEVGALIRAFDWSRTKLGAVDDWPLGLRAVVDLVVNSPLPMVLMWGDDHVMIYNDGYSVIAGPRHPAALGGTVPKLWPEIWDWNRAILQAGFRGEMLTYRDQRMTVERRGHPEEVVFDLFYTPVRTDGPDVQGVLCTVIETTERVLTTERLRIAQSAGRIGAFEWHPDTGRLDASEEYLNIYGLPPHTTITQDNLLALVHPDDLGATAPSRMQTPNPLSYAEYRITRPDNGETRWIARRGETLPSDGRLPARYVGVAFDITERKVAEEAFVESENRFRAMADSAPALIWACDETGQTTFANRRYETELGLPPERVVRSGWRQLVHAEDADTFEADFFAALRAHREFRTEVRVWDKRGRLRWLRCEGVPRLGVGGAFLGYVGCNVDITEARMAADELEAEIEARTRDLQETEEALRQAQKMEAVGQLTGGIAHDFNNLLTGIVGSLDLMQTRIAQGRMEGLDRYVRAATTSANRAASLTHRLLAFARRQPLDPKTVSVNVLVASMDELLRRTLGESVKLEIVASGGLWLTLCDPNQLESAILNLAINARDAMPGGGRLTIETANAHLDNAYVAAQRDLEPGQYVAICVTDTGTGMPPDVIARAFDPFFTTKAIGQGTGLGLSMVYGFAKQSGGHVRIYSEVGEGTTVKIYLPRHFGTMSEERAAESFEAQLSLADETVLVVEDEPVVRNLVVEVLEDLGYRAVEAADGPAGLKIIETGQRIDLLVSDIGLPGLNGRQLADRARVLRPDLKVLFMTGYAENAAVAGGFLEPGMEMITKPFAVDALATRIRSMIGDR